MNVFKHRKAKTRARGTSRHESADKKRARTYKVFLALAAVVVFSTTYALILPVITMEKETFCGYEEEHTHSAACYTEDHVLTCDRAGHTHTLQCFSNPEADVETSDVWERSFADITLTGNLPEDVVAVAQTQLGYQESTENYEVQEDGVTIKGYTRYGECFSDPYGDWSAMFAAFCIHYAKGEGFPLEIDCQKWMDVLRQETVNLYLPAAEYVPCPGDLVFLQTNGRTAADHVGIVTEVTGADRTAPAGITVIEGDCDGQVRYMTYTLGDSCILGYGEMPKPQSGDAPSPGRPFTLTSETEDGVGVTVTGLTDALPFPAEEITMTASRVRGSNMREQLARAAAADGLSPDSMYLLDVSLWHGGEVIEPTGTVTVTFLNICPEGESASVYHVQPGAAMATNMDAASENGNAVFDTDHFSAFGVVLEPASGKTVSGEAVLTWDSDTNTISDVSVTASSSDLDKAYFYVQYYDETSSSWVSGVTSSDKVGKGNPVTLSALTLLADANPADRQYRAYAAKDKDSGYSAAFTLGDLFEGAKPGFTAWLEDSYVQDFGGPAIPQTQGALITAYALYQSLPTATMQASLQPMNDAERLMLSVSLDQTLANPVYQWQYYDRQSNVWTDLPVGSVSQFDATELTQLKDGADVRCRVLDGNDNNALKTVSNILTVNNSTQVLPNETTVTVTKKWKGSAEARPENVTVRLYQNGAEAGSVVLSNDNLWKHTFELPYHDENGNAYQYTVSEDTVENYTTSYSDVAVISDITTHYLSSLGLQSGASYALVGNGFVISGNGSISGTSAEIENDSVTYNWVTYPAELTAGVSKNGVWTVTDNGDGTVTLSCGGYYLAAANDGKLSLRTEGGSPFSLDSDGYLSFPSGNKTKYVSVKNEKGTVSLVSTDNKGNATPFTFFEAVDIRGSYEQYGYTITNAVSHELLFNKYIDYLGDDGENPDTDLTGEYFRQYLDVEAQATTSVDILFVVDNTSSMLAKDFDENKELQRDQAISDILNGSHSSAAGATEEGLLTQVLRANENNRAAVITFCGIGSGGMSYNQMLSNLPEVHTVLDWHSLNSPTDVADFADILYKDGGGTCYEAGLLAAEALMQTLSEEDDNAKVVIFLGDGEPNGVLLNTSGDIASKDELGDKDHIFFSWDKEISDGVRGTKNAMDYFVEQTEALAGSFQDQVDLYTIGVGSEATGEGENDILGYMADKGNGHKYIVKDITEARTAFNEIVSRYLFADYTITDNLSQYVELYTENLDLQVVRKSLSNQQETVIWSGTLNGDGTIGEAANGGESYIQSVTYEANKEPDSSGTVTVTFRSDYILEPGYQYIVSYNLKTTEAAETEYAANGYGDTVGSAGTDYPGNETSSGKPGLPSNQSAFVSYMMGGKEKDDEYPHPVIQVGPVAPSDVPLTISKTVSGSDTDKSFQFTAVLSDGAFPAPAADAGYTVDTDGAHFRLANGESVTLRVPAGAVVTLTEVNSDGFQPLIKNGSMTLANGDTATFEVSSETGITVLNTTGYKMPHTGGPGTVLFVLGGGGLMAAAALSLLRQRREGEGW